jgi:hypothetical protein
MNDAHIARLQLHPGDIVKLTDGVNREFGGLQVTR